MKRRGGGGGGEQKKEELQKGHGGGWGVREERQGEREDEIVGYEGRAGE